MANENFFDIELAETIKDYEDTLNALKHVKPFFHKFPFDLENFRFSCAQFGLIGYEGCSVIFDLYYNDIICDFSVWFDEIVSQNKIIINSIDENAIEEKREFDYNDIITWSQEKWIKEYPFLEKLKG